MIYRRTPIANKDGIFKVVVQKKIDKDSSWISVKNTKHRFASEQEANDEGLQIIKQDKKKSKIDDN